MQASYHTTPVTRFAPDRRAGRALRSSRWRLVVGLFALIFSLQPLGLAAAPAAGRVSEALPNAGAPTAAQFFNLTGKAVRGDFYKTFERYGLERLGYPITEEVVENGQTVQYFERVRMELHPELAAKGYGVLFTRLGAELNKEQQTAPVAPVRSTGTLAYVKETGHTLAEPFLSYWRDNGGVPLFGYPISEAVTENGLLVQWFERARFEYHSELANGGKPLLLGLLGRMALDKSPVVVSRPVEPAAPAGSKAAVSASLSLAGNEDYLLKGINEQRTAAGVGALAFFDPATSLARDRAGDMAKRNYFSHKTPEGNGFLQMLVDRGVKYKYAGEILARNNFPDADAARVALESYLNSPPHRAILLDGRYNLVGAGYAKRAEDGMHYFAVIFVQQ